METWFQQICGSLMQVIYDQLAKFRVTGRGVSHQVCLDIQMYEFEVQLAPALHPLATAGREPLLQLILGHTDIPEVHLPLRAPHPGDLRQRSAGTCDCEHVDITQVEVSYYLLVAIIIAFLP